MSMDGPIRFFAGCMILLSHALALPAVPLYASQNFLWLTAFVGATLLQFSLTNFCPLAIVLKKLGVKEGTGGCGGRACS